MSHAKRCFKKSAVLKGRITRQMQNEDLKQFEVSEGEISLLSSYMMRKELACAKFARKHDRRAPQQWALIKWVDDSFCC